MPFSIRLAAPAGALALACAAGSAGAQAPAVAPQPTAATTPPLPAERSAPPAQSGLDARLFYEILLGELSAGTGDPATGFTLLLDAARQQNDAQLYQRATELALRARAGDSALQAARAWRQAFPDSREANRFVLQILVAMNRVAETAEPLAREIAMTPKPARGTAYLAIPPLYARAADKALAAQVVERALAADLADSAGAWVAVGRMRLAAGDRAGALDAVRRGQALDATADGPVMLALEMQDGKVPQAEALVRDYLARPDADPALRVAYARTLIDQQRYADALREAERASTDKPALADAWLIRGTLHAELKQPAAAEAALNQYLDLQRAAPGGATQSRGVAQAYLVMAQIAEERGDLRAAEGWLSRIENAQDLLAAHNRRAALLAKQGKLAEARTLLRSAPARTPSEARARTIAEAALLREAKQYQAAYEVLAEALRTAPDDPELLYDQAMVADKLRRADEMEVLLRRAIAEKPDFHHAYNALGYAFAERGVRLGEARELVKKALEYAPGDPYISDSLGWVEFRAGNREEALRILDAAFKSQPDAEIAAHLGEVLWSLGQSQRALAVWKEGLKLNGDNETLRETLRRLKVKP